MAKTQPSERISKIQPGQKDHSGNTVLHVLASGNEYCIYEIDHCDINYRLRISIDGFTDESEERLTRKFNKVKQKYIEAKGLLYRSSNYGIMKNRVAHTLATCLSSETEPDGTEFDELISTIKNEARQIVRNKVLFILPSIILTILAAGICVCKMDWRDTNFRFWQILIVIFSSLLGSSLSLLARTKSLKFEEYADKWFYCLLGFERIFLACIAGTIAYVLLRSRLVFPQFPLTDFWKIMSLVIAASFSERFIPSALERLNTDEKNK